MTPKRASEKSICKRQAAPAWATTAHRDNDTSVTRGPATKKAGRFNSYGAASQAAAFLLIDDGVFKKKTHSHLSIIAIMEDVSII